MNDAQQQSTGRKRRRDYEQNRAAILSAADEAFAEAGIEVPIEVIAKRAGLAPATVYRHFPSRNALTEAVYELRIDTYADAIEAAQQVDDHEQAFRRTVHDIVALQARDRSFREIIGTRTASPIDDPRFMRFGAALLGALQRARDARVLRNDVQQEDVMLLLLASEGVARPVAGESPEALARYVDLALDGLCRNRTTPPGTPLEFDQLLNVGRS